MQKRFAQDNFSKKSPCIATNTQKKFQKVFVNLSCGSQQLQQLVQYFVNVVIDF